MRGRRARILLLAFLGLVAPVHAESLSERLSLHGFFTLDGSLADGHDIVLPTAGSEPLLLEDGEPSFDSSVLGVQANWEATDDLSLTAQVISTAQTEGNYTPELEWAYLSYDFGQDLHARAGLRRVPLFQGSELRYVGFSRLWVRPIVPTAGAGGFEQYVGAELTKGLQWKGFNVELQGLIGEAEHHIDTVDDARLALLSARFEQDDSWIKFALLHTRYDVFTLDGNRIGDDVDATMGSIEAEWLSGPVILNVGASYSDADINPDERFAYLSFGYRLGRFTPFLLGQHRQLRHDASAFPRPPPGRMPPPPGRGPGNLPPLLDGTLEINAVALGMRFDLSSRTALKIQVERQFIDNDSLPPAEREQFEANLYSLVFEGVF